MKDLGKVIYIIIGVAAILVSYLLGFNTLSGKNTELQQEVDELQADYDRLKADYGNKDEYIKETKEFEKGYEEILSKFDKTLLNEGQIMDIYNMQAECGIDVTSVIFTEPMATYAFDGSITSDFVTMSQTPQTNPDGTPVEEDPIITTTAIDSSYRGISNSLQLTAEGSYEGIKQMLNTIIGAKKRKVPSNISFTFDSIEEKVICNLTMYEYAITGKDREPEPEKIDIPDSAIGRSNIFFNPLGTATQTP